MSDSVDSGGMDSERVAAYLKQHPEFFEQYADVLSQIYVAHPHGGRAIALADRQVLTLRERNKVAEAKLAELLQFGEENDAIGEKMHRLATALLSAQGLDAALGALYYNLREDFAVPHAAVRAWNLDTEGPEATPVSDELKQYSASLAQPYCGASENAEAASWFGEAGPNVRSVALMALREPGPAGTAGAVVGLLALGSEDVERFYPDMGTLYLQRMGELASAALARYL
jgi:uncharacterized protein YigA (DUF484 family)